MAAHRMNDQRQGQLGCDVDLRLEPRQLCSEIAVKGIKTTLTKPHAALGPGRKPSFQNRQVLLAVLANEPGMNTKTIPEPARRGRQRLNPIPIHPAYPRNHQRLHTPSPGRIQNLIANPVKFGEIEMTMGIDQLHGTLRWPVSVPGFYGTGYQDNAPEPDSG